jgi:hypothetical protein
MLTSLYERAEEEGITVLHAVSSEELGVLHRMAGCRRVDMPGAVLMSLTRPPEPGALALRGRRHALTTAIYLAQRVAAAGVGGLVRLTTRAWVVSMVRPATLEDAVFCAEGSTPSRGWTIVPTDSWAWWIATGFFRVLEWEGNGSSAALVREGQSDHEFDQLVAWRSVHGGLRDAVRCLAGVHDHARQRGRAGLRVQLWPGLSRSRLMERACRLLGFLPRQGGVTLYTRAPATERWSKGHLVASPFFYLTF